MSNPKVAQAMPIVKQIIANGGTKREQLQQACKMGGIDPKQAEETIKKFGINL